MTTFEVPTLREKAITVRLVRTAYQPNVKDEYATNIVAGTTGVSKAGKFTKKLLQGCVELKEAQRASVALYQYVTKNTLPWMDEGIRVLPSETYMDFATEVARLQNNCKQAVENLANVWDYEVQKDQAILGSLWDINDYPTESRMRERWSFRVMFAPVPTSDDFRIDVSDEDKEELDKAVREVEAGATTHIIKEILSPISAMVKRLSIPTGDKGSVFRDTLVTNLTDVCSRAKKLNINNDDRIDEVVNEISSILSGVTADELRANESSRKETAEAMADIEKKMNDWF